MLQERISGSMLLNGLAATPKLEVTLLLSFQEHLHLVLTLDSNIKDYEKDTIFSIGHYCLDSGCWL
jgi:hypothetical protein